MMDSEGYCSITEPHSLARALLCETLSEPKRSGVHVGL